MAIIKCKMCGGDLNIDVGMTVAKCEYCGTRQTVPTADNEKKLTLFARANRLRAACEFDKAASVYESIVAEFPTEAEAYWGLVLCRYGIEYVDDPATGKKIPTCHRSSFESILEDPDFEQAQENADAVSRKVYREEAKAIEDIRRRIVELSGKEQPYDVFICYKETDENGERTPDSVMAQEVYDALTEKGLRVFFSRITLEDKLGTEYEPYIFAALNSAKVMLVFGTDYEYFNAVWVKNEWSRFLALIASGQKKHLIPCYKGVDAYDMPKEFAHLQGQDMGKLGAVQDLVRGVEKLLGKGAAAQPAQPVIVQAAGGVSSDALLKRGNMALNDGNWKAADEFFDRVLDMNAECAEAWLGKFLARVQASDIAQYAQAKIDQAKKAEISAPKEAVEEDAARVDAAAQRFAVRDYLAEKDVRAQYAPPEPYRSVADYWRQAASLGKSRLASDADLTKARNFATGAIKERLAAEEKAFVARWDECVKQAERRDAQAKEAARKAYAQALDESDRKAEALCKAAEEKREGVYQELCREQAEAENIFYFGSLAANFERLKDYKDSAARAQQCQKKVEELQALEAAERKRAEREEAQKRKRNRNIALIVVLSIAIIAIAAWYITQVFIPAKNYQAAEALYASGEYAQAVQAFEAMGDYKDAPERALAAHYTHAEALLAAGDDNGALAEFALAGNYQDAAERISAIYYAKAEAAEAEGDMTAAAMLYGRSGDHSNARERSFALWEQVADRETVSAGENHTVGLKSDGTVVATKYTWDSEYYYNGQCDVANWRDIVAVSAGNEYTVGLKSDGTVMAVGRNYGGRCDVADWTDIVAVSAGWYHTVGLKSDGTVVAVGDNDYGQCDVAGWTDIVAVSAGDDYTVGLKSDGTVVAVGNNDYGQCDVADWTDIVAVSAGRWHTVGLKSDGTVVATEYTGSTYFYEDQCDVADWTDVKLSNRAMRVLSDHYTLAEELLAAGDADGAAAEFEAAGDYEDAPERAQEIRYTQAEAAEAEGDMAAAAMLYGRSGDYSNARERSFALWEQVADRETVSAGSWHTVGLKSDGTVVAVGYNDYVQCDAADWTDIVAVSAGWYHTVGLKSDGTVVAVGYNDDGRCDVADWTDIVAVSAGNGHTVGLKSDGTAVAVGNNEYGQCGVADWTDIVAVSAGNAHTVGLKSDGTVVAKELTEYFYDGRCDVADWTDIVAVSAGGSHTVGLKSDGTAVAVGNNEYGQCDVADWTDILVRS